MEWCIPIQTFEVTNVQVGTLLQGPKPLAPIAYKDSDFTFPSLVLLLPKLKVKSYEPQTGRLVLSLQDSPQTLSKLKHLQHNLYLWVFGQQSRWFPGQQFKSSDILNSFQSMLQEKNDQELHLYCPCQQPQGSTSQPLIQGPSVYTKGAWSKNSLQPGTLVPGTSVRIALRIQGISFHIHPMTGRWTGKYRLQHKILGMLF